MTPDRNTYADIWEMLDGKYAERVRVTDAALVGDEEIVRRWPEISPGYLSRCMTALKLFTDSKNSKAQLWVRDPVCGRETFPGIYRVVTVDVDVQKPGLKGIIQTLRRGWAQTPVWSEARLLEEEAGPANDVADSGAVPASDNPTRFLKIKFPNCDPGKVEAIASSLGGVSTYSNVVIRGESYSGTWNTVWVATKLEDDGSGTVVLYLALGQYNIKSYDNWGTEREADIFYVYDCPKNEAQTIINAWKAKYPVGSSATTNYSRSNGLVDLVLRRKTETDFKANFGKTGLDCRYTETQTAIFGTRDEDAYSIPKVNHDAGISYTRTARSNGDGSFDIILTKREVRYRNITGLVVEQTGESETVQRQQLGLTDETPEPMTEEPGAIKTQRVEVRDDCSRDVTTNTETGKEQVTTEKTVARSYEEETTETTYQDAELDPPEQETGKIKTVRNTPSKYPGRWNVLERIRSILHIPSAVKYDSRDDAAAHEQVEESLGVPNDKDVSVVLSADAGTALRANVRYDKESDTLDVSKVTIEAKEQITTEITEARSYRETVTQKTAQAVPLVNPTAETGKIKTVRNEASDFTDLYDTTERVREIKQIDEAVVYDSADDAAIHGRTVERLGQPNDGVAVVLAARAGESLSASVRYDKETDTLDVVEQTVTAKELEETAKTEAAGFSQTTTAKTAAASKVAAPIAVPGHVKTAKNSKSKYEGLWDTEETDRQVKPLNATAAGGSPLWDEVAEVNDNANNDLSGQAAGGVGVIIDTASKQNDAGRFNNRKTTRTAKPYGPVTSIHGSPLVNETVELSRNQDSMPSPGTPADGTMIDVSGSINDAAKIDVTKTTRRAIPRESLALATGEDEFKSEKTDLHVNKDSVEVTRAAGEVVDASIRISEFGKLDATVRKSTAKPVVSGPFTEHDDGYKKTTKTIHRNVDSVPAVTMDDNGHEISVQVNEHGKKDVVETKTTVNPFDIDIDEPSIGNTAPRYQRICYGLRGANEIQPKVNEFKSKVAAQTGHQYRITASVHRDESGFYIVTLTANPKDSSGGGGSATQWETGLDVNWPHACMKYQNVTTTKAVTKLTSSRATAQAFINTNPGAADGLLVDRGVAGQTGCFYIGRGRFIVVKNYKAS